MPEAEATQPLTQKSPDHIGRGSLSCLQSLCNWASTRKPRRRPGLNSIVTWAARQLPYRFEPSDSEHCGDLPHQRPFNAAFPRESDNL